MTSDDIQDPRTRNPKPETRNSRLGPPPASEAPTRDIPAFHRGPEGVGPVGAREVTSAPAWAMDVRFADGMRRGGRPPASEAPTSHRQSKPETRNSKLQLEPPASC